MDVYRLARQSFATLTELVALKDLKDQLDGNVYCEEQENALWDEYARRKPVAWASARQLMLSGAIEGSLSALNSSQGQSGRPDPAPGQCAHCGEYRAAETGADAPSLGSEAARIAAQAASVLAGDPHNRFAADVYRHARVIELQERRGKTA